MNDGQLSQKRMMAKIERDLLSKEKKVKQLTFLIPLNCMFFLIIQLNNSLSFMFHNLKLESST
jgi:hypothetical protein